MNLVGVKLVPFVAGAWSCEDRIAVEIYNEGIAHIRALEDELRDCEDENGRPPNWSWFSVELKPYRPTADLRFRIMEEKRRLAVEHDRLFKAGTGVRYRL